MTDKKHIISEITAVISEVIQLLSSLNEEETYRVPFKGSWSAAQIAEHLLKSYAVVETLKKEVKQTERRADEKISDIKALFLNFEIKMESPEFIRPSAVPIDKEELLHSLAVKRLQFAEVIASTNLSDTCLSFAIPEFGEFTRLEWIYFVIYHTQRHIHQMREMQLKKIF